MIRAINQRKSQSANTPLVARFLRGRLFTQLEQISFGRLLVTEGGQSHCFGTDEGPQAEIKIKSSRFYRSILGGSTGIGGSFIDGDWDCCDLTELFQILLRNQHCLNNVNGLKSFFVKALQRVGHFLNRNSQSGSQRNIAAHYDLGNDFYKLWLDETMTYSSGIFCDLSDSMLAASEEKLDRVCRKLDLDDNSDVVEIGTGWGGFAIHAASHYDCNVTSTTISQQQYDEARIRVNNAELYHKVKLLQDDYRNLTGQFDRLVSIEMIEAVGHQYLDQYFQKCSQLLKPDGSMLIQAITMPEKHYAQYLSSVDFIQKYIFPGGCLPSISAILESVGRVSDLRFVHTEDLAPHYAETLRRWRQTFDHKIEDVKALGYPDSFIRMWRYYLCYCEAAFEERHIGVHQLVFDKPLCRRDPITITNQASGRSLFETEHLAALA